MPSGASTRMAVFTPHASAVRSPASAREAADRDGDDGRARRLAVPQGHLDRRLVGSRQARRRRVADPLDAHGDHQVVRKMTPYPPSGYDQLIAPSWLQTR